MISGCKTFGPPSQNRLVNSTTFQRDAETLTSLSIWVKVHFAVSHHWQHFADSHVIQEISNATVIGSVRRWFVVSAYSSCNKYSCYLNRGRCSFWLVISCSANTTLRRFNDGAVHTILLEKRYLSGDFVSSKLFSAAFHSPTSYQNRCLP